METGFLKSCDILLYKGGSFTSKLIEWKTGSLYSHVAVVVSADIFLGIESNTGSQAGVRAFDLRKLDAKEVDAFRLKEDFKIDAAKVISFLVGHLGDSYDFAGVTWLGVLKVFGFQAKANQFQRDRDYFCSELVYRAFQEGGLDIVPQIDEADITSPGDIAASPRLQKIGTLEP